MVFVTNWSSFLYINVPLFILTLGLIFALYLYQRWFFKDKVEVIYKDTNHNRMLLENCKSISTEYHYPIWGSSGHVQTFYAQALRFHKSPVYRREFLDAQDGGIIVLDWVEEPKRSANDPIIVILPGICSTANSNYIRNFARHCSNAGHRVVVYIPRGCEELKSPRLFTLGDTSDFRQTIHHMKKTFPDAPIVACAFSLGGNVLVNYLGECGKANQDSFITGAISMGQGFDFIWGIEHLRTVPFYDYGMAMKLKRVLQKHKSLFEESIDVPFILKNVKTVEDFDRHFTCKVHGFESPRKYYELHSCKNHLPFVKTQLFLLHARDDPLVIREMIPTEIPLHNENVIMIVTEHGGHLGWAEGFLMPRSMHWNERTALDCISTLLRMPKIH